MKILVTGGAGFIGSHVVDAYIAQGHEVAVVDNLSTGDPANLDPKARLIKMDVASPAMAGLMKSEGFEVVNHHAAQVSVPASAKDPMADLEANGKGTLNLLTAAAAAGVGRFIFISSGGAIYGEQESLPTPENAPIKPLSPYAAHKLLGESYLPFFEQDHGLKWVVLRYANVYGPRQAPHAEAGVTAIFTKAILNGVKPTIYRYRELPRGMVRDYVFVSDVVLANLAALEKGEGRVFNIGTGVGATTLDLYEHLRNAAGQGMDPDFGPPRPGDLKRSILDSTEARRGLGWEPKVDLAEGCRRTVEWARG